MTATMAQWATAGAAVISVLPTLATLLLARNDRANRRVAGINGSLEAIATQAVRREAARIIKHILLAVAVCLSIWDHPQPWITALVCMLLSATSMMEIHFRRVMEGRLWRDRLKLEGRR